VPKKLFKPPKNIIKEWPEVFEDMYMNTMPVAYLNNIKLEFNNGRIWELRVPDMLAKSEAPVRAQAAQNEVLTDLDIAKSYRSQADAMYKEAARLRKQADELDPPKKKVTKTAEETSA
jgi:hypothetical protein